MAVRGNVHHATYQTLFNVFKNTWEGGVLIQVLLPIGFLSLGAKFWGGKNQDIPGRRKSSARCVRGASTPPCSLV